jgi:two-component system phosphate regulon sensor histidine kinase PhoR
MALKDFLSPISSLLSKKNRNNVSVFGTPSSLSHVDKLFTTLLAKTNKPELVREPFSKYDQARREDDSKREQALIAAYTSFEQFFTHATYPVVIQEQTAKQLRKEISQNIQITELNYYFRLIFLPELEQTLRLSELGIRMVSMKVVKSLGTVQLQKLIDTTIAGTVLQDILVIPKDEFIPTINTHAISHITEVSKVIDALHKLNEAIFQQAALSLGKNAAKQIFKDSYETIKWTYPLDIVGLYIDILPREPFENEKMNILSREDLERTVTERTNQVKEAQKLLEDKIRQIEQQNKTLESNKQEMIRLLNDAHKLEEQLKVEKASVEKKIIERTKELHAEQTKLQASINSLSVGYIMVDKDYNILIINNAAKQTLCASAVSPYTTVTECNFVHIENELKQVLNLRAFINQCFIEKKPLLLKELRLKNRYFKIFITPIITLGVIGVVILIDDITEAKVIERSKDEFFSIASHELRTPLTAIRGNTSMIQEFYADKLTDPQLVEMLQDIHSGSVRLISIVNDFLDTSRLEMKKMVFKNEAFDLVQLVKDTVKEYETTGATKNLYLKLELPAQKLPFVFADKDKVKQILINLIGNAIKFTDSGGVSLRIMPESNFVKVFVADTGRGISHESQNLLFRKFQQAQENTLTRDTTKGTGLGLYISKLLMEGMRGLIKIESSELGKGTTFSISLPFASPVISTKPVTNTADSQVT